ncbi:MAG: sensor histidine kinase, partial [Flavobacterium sp.]
ESIMRLSNIMRYVTDDAVQDFVLLKDEINCIRDYIELQRLRLGADAEINFKVTGQPGQKKIGPIILMTFIENAFKYGVTKKEKTVISISLIIEEDNVHFLCENKIYPNTTKLERAGVGIDNTQRRLKHLYPNKFELNINQNNELFSVRLSLDC